MPEMRCREKTRFNLFTNVVSLIVVVTSFRAFPMTSLYYSLKIRFVIFVYCFQLHKQNVS